jgi:Cu2+-exporting ATPase
LTDIDTPCYHCGSPLEGARFTHTLGGAPRQFCCAGCQAIAQTIHGQGLEAFYARRLPTEEKPSPDSLQDTPPARLLVFDDAALLNRYVRVVEGVDEVTLRLSKIRCAACVWLNEQHLRRVPGVVEVEANYVTQRARIRFRREVCALSRLLHAVEAIGYEASPFELSLAADAARRERASMLMRLGVAMLGMMQVMMYAWPAYSGTQDLTAEHAALLGWAGFALTVPVLLYSAAPIFRNAFDSLRHLPRTGMLGMDVPVALALLLAAGAGTVNLLRGSGETYFDSITMFVALLLLARYIELRARHDARSGAEALALQLPATCERLDKATGQAAVIPVVRAQLGDLLRVAPGDAVPVDGQVIDGASAVDEALLTGEARPIAKHPGDTVLAGSFNLTSPLVIEVRAVGQATRLAGIAALLDRALNEKPHLVGITEKWAGYFVAALLVIALATGLVWAAIGEGDAWVRAVAVLVVSCPCALSLATPAALAAAQGALARAGLLVVRGHAIESVAQAQDLVLDKTGTVTTGALALCHIEVLREGCDANAMLSLAAGLEAGQKHPIAKAFVSAANARGLAAHSFPTTPRGVVGQGVECERFRLGSAHWTGVPALGEVGLVTQVWLRDDTGPLARFDLQDELRDGAPRLIAAARQAGLAVHLLSGDSAQTVEAYARHLDIPHWKGEASPEDKQAFIQALQQQGRVVWAVGDGINDAPQLAQANVSVAVGSGAPLAQAGADLVLTRASCAPLAALITQAQKTRRVIGQNLVWAAAYNLLAIPAAALGLIGPFGAAIGMTLSSLLVTLNAARLARLKGF